MIRKIQLTVDPCSTGDSSPEKYADHLESSLKSEYPDASVSVSVGIGAELIYADTWQEEEEVERFRRDCWDRYNG